MRAFISHNRADLATARLLAVALVEYGVDVWFDEWELRPGDSITGGIEEGISSADAFVLVWSEQAATSEWVGTELRATVRRRVDDKTLRIIPILVDDTPLPALVADYRGFVLSDCAGLHSIAAEIAGNPSAIDIARCLQKRLLELAVENLPEEHELKALICPKCGSDRLSARRICDAVFVEVYFLVTCEECNWGEAVKCKDRNAVPGQEPPLRGRPRGRCS